MLLTIDIGNTMTDFALFEGEEATHFHRIRTHGVSTDEEVATAFSLFLEAQHLDASKVNGAIISSVVPALTASYEKTCSLLFGIEALVLSPETETGIRIETDNPREVGADMIAAAVGAFDRFGASCIVADCGTANKVFLLDKDGAFAGCVIGAGLGLQLSSLSKDTALLPEISPQIPPQILGKNTPDCMGSGITYGNAFAVKALSDGIEREAGYPCKRILTGGYSAFIAELLPEFAHEPHLIHSGLRGIYLRNKK